MDALRFDRLARTLASMPTRRAMLGLSTAGLLAVLGLDDADAKKHKKKKKCKKKCGPCAKCKKGKCKPKPVGTACGEGKQCFAKGTCVACDVCANDCPHATLEEALEDAADGATIHICSGAYPTNASIADKTLTVIGAGSGPGGTTLDGGGAGTVIRVDGATVTLCALRVTGGHATDGGGIRSFSATLTLDACVVSENEATNGGGGIYNIGTLILTDSTVSENEAAFGGGIFNSGGTATLDAPSRVTENRADDGGGIYNSGGPVTLASAANVSGNTPNECAGADVPLCEVEE